MSVGLSPSLHGGYIYLGPQRSLMAKFLSLIPVVATECYLSSTVLHLLHILIHWILTATPGGRSSYYDAFVYGRHLQVGYQHKSHSVAAYFCPHLGLTWPSCFICNQIKRQNLPLVSLPAKQPISISLDC